MSPLSLGSGLIVVLEQDVFKTVLRKCRFPVLLRSSITFEQSYLRAIRKRRQVPLTVRRNSVYLFVENNLVTNNEQFFFQRPWFGQ